MTDQNNSLPSLPSIMLSKPVKCNMFNRTFVSKAVPVFQKNQSNWKKEVIYGPRNRSTFGSCFVSFWNRVKFLCVTAYRSFLSFCPHHWGCHVLIDVLAHILPWNTTLLLWNLFYMLPFKIFSWSKPPTPSLPLHCLLLLSQRSNTNAFVSLHIFQNLTLWASLSRCPMGTGTAQEMAKRENSREKNPPQKTPFNS